MEQALNIVNTLPATQQASSDSQLLDLWLHGRSEHTQRAYDSAAYRFLSHVGKPLQQVTLGDVQGFADSLVGLSPASQSALLSAVKSLLSFGHRLGYLPFDVGRAYKLPKQKNTLAERILPEGDVQRILALEENPRNHLMLRLLYAGGLRVSELCGLKWRDLQPRGNETGQVVAYGKGGKTRTVLLPPSVWADLQAIKGNAGPDDPVFPSRKGKGHLDPSRVMRIVRAAARRAGISVNVSPHWLRHAHASHALDRGAPISLVAATLGHSNISTTGRYLHARPSASSAQYLAV